MTTNNKHIPTRGMSDEEIENHREITYVLTSFLGASPDTQKLDFLISAISTNDNLTKATVANLAHFGNTISKEITNDKHKRHIIKDTE